MSGLLAVLVASSWLFGPGLLLLAAARVRASSMAVAVVPVGVLALGWVGILFRFFGVRFDPASVAATLIVAAAVMAGVAWWRARNAHRNGFDAVRRVGCDPIVRAAAAGCATASLITTAMWASTPGWLSRPGQYVDSFWHAYVIGLVRFRGLADPWSLVPIDPVSSGPRVYYPYGLHLVGGLVAWGTDAARALAAVQFLAAAVVAPIGVAVLARTVLGRRPVAVAAAPIMVSLVGVWQVRLGPIPAYQLGIACAPGMLAMLLRATTSRRSAVLAGIAAGGLWLIQPAATILFAIPWVLCWCWPPAAAARWAVYRTRLRSSSLVVLTAAAVALPWLVSAAGVGASVVGAVRPGGLRFTTAVANALLLTLNRLASPWLTVGLFLIGLALSLRGRLPRWLSAAYLVACALFGLSASSNFGFRAFLVAPWVGDWWRILPLVAVLSALLAAGALDWLLVLARDRKRKLAGGALAACLLVITTWHVAPSQRDVTAGLRRPTVVLDQDVATYRWLNGRIYPGQRVLNCWSDGSAWMYGLFGVPVVDPYLVTLPRDPGLRYVMGHLGELGDNAELDRLVLSRNIRYAIVEDTFLTRHTPHYCFRVPIGNRFVSLVHEVPGGRVYSIDLSGLAAAAG